MKERCELRKTCMKQTNKLEWREKETDQAKLTKHERKIWAWKTCMKQPNKLEWRENRIKQN